MNLKVYFVVVRKYREYYSSAVAFCVNSISKACILIYAGQFLTEFIKFTQNFADWVDLKFINKKKEMAPHSRKNLQVNLSLNPSYSIKFNNYLNIRNYRNY